MARKYIKRGHYNFLNPSCIQISLSTDSTKLVQRQSFCQNQMFICVSLCKSSITELRNKHKNTSIEYTQRKNLKLKTDDD